MSLSAAISHVRSKRWFINPNPGFLRQLQRYQGELKNTGTVPQPTYSGNPSGGFPELGAAYPEPQPLTMSSLVPSMKSNAMNNSMGFSGKESHRMASTGHTFTQASQSTKGVTHSQSKSAQHVHSPSTKSEKLDRIPRPIDRTN